MNSSKWPLPVQPLLAGLLMGVILTSCGGGLTVQKRRYNPGYYVDLGLGRSRNADELTTPRTARSSEAYHSTELELDLNQQGRHGRSAERASGVAGRGDVRDLREMTNTQEHIVERRRYQESAATNTLRSSYGRSFHEEHLESLIDEVGSQNIASTSTQEADGDNKSKLGLRVTGIVLASTGFLILLFASWLVGLVIMLLGLGLLLAGLSDGSSRSSGNRKARQEEPTWQDVVYLKNGSVIKGIVIEQVPNESLKIQTTDGSIFVYEMNQVAKIAKELKPSK